MLEYLKGNEDVGSLNKTSIPKPVSKLLNSSHILFEFIWSLQDSDAALFGCTGEVPAAAGAPPLHPPCAQPPVSPGSLHTHQHCSPLQSAAHEVHIPAPVSRLPVTCMPHRIAQVCLDMGLLSHMPAHMELAGSQALIPGDLAK